MTKKLEKFEERDEWDQLPDEPTYWYDLFTQYRLLGATRTLRKLYRMKRDEKGLKALPREWGASTSWTQKAREWKWIERAEAWDDFIREKADETAEGVLSEGLALPHVRIEKLKRVAEKLEDYILDPKVTKISSYVIEQYRGVLDDIAKETGGRVKETRFTAGNNGSIQQIVTVWGRGGSASEAWEQKQLEAPAPDAIEAEVTEIPEDENGKEVDQRADKATR